MPVGEHWTKQRDMKDRHARMGAKADIEALYEQIQAIGRAYPGLLDEMEDEARPRIPESARDDSEAIPATNGSLPAVETSAQLDPKAEWKRKISNSLRGRKQSPEAIRKRLASRARNFAARAKADKPPGRRKAK